MSVTCIIWIVCIHKMFTLWFPVFQCGCKFLGNWCQDLQPSRATCLSLETFKIVRCDLGGRQFSPLRTNVVKRDPSRFRRMLSQLKNRVLVPMWKTYGALDRYRYVTMSDCMFHKQIVETCTKYYVMPRHSTYNEACYRLFSLRW